MNGRNEFYSLSCCAEQFWEGWITKSRENRRTHAAARVGAELGINLSENWASANEGVIAHVHLDRVDKMHFSL